MTERSDQVAELASQGMNSAAVAKKLEISQQRVYQLAKVAGVNFEFANPPSRRSLPIPKVVTGGVTMPVNTTTAGTIAEVLVMADLMARGWHVYMPVVRHKGHDLIACGGDRMVTIEVRSAKRNASGKLIFLKQSYDKSDFYALVDTGVPVEYEPDIGSVTKLPKYQ